MFSCAPPSRQPAPVQGSGMAALATGMQRAGFAYKDAPLLRFAVCFAGIRWAGGRRGCGEGWCVWDVCRSLLQPELKDFHPAAATQTSPLLLCLLPLRVRDPSLECFYSAMRPVPSIHIIGDKVRCWHSGMSLCWAASLACCCSRLPARAAAHLPSTARQLPDRPNAHPGLLPSSIPHPRTPSSF